MAERMIAKTLLIEPSLLERCEEFAAQDGRFQYRGMPSANEVIRMGTRLFFALADSEREQLLASVIDQEAA